MKTSGKAEGHLPYTTLSDQVLTMLDDQDTIKNSERLSIDKLTQQNPLLSAEEIEIIINEAKSTSSKQIAQLLGFSLDHSITDMDTNLTGQMSDLNTHKEADIDDAEWCALAHCSL